MEPLIPFWGFRLLNRRSPLMGYFCNNRKIAGLFFFFFFSPPSELKTRNMPLGAICLFLGMCLFSSFCFHVYLRCLASNKDHMSSQGSLALFSLKEAFQDWCSWRKNSGLVGKLPEFHTNPAAKRTQSLEFTAYGWGSCSIPGGFSRTASAPQAGKNPALLCVKRWTARVDFNPLKPKPHLTCV